MKKLLSLAICTLTILSMATTSFAASAQTTPAIIEDAPIDSSSFFDLQPGAKVYNLTNVTAEEAIENINAMKLANEKASRLRNTIEPSVTYYNFSSPEEHEKFLNLLASGRSLTNSASIKKHTINPNSAKTYSPPAGGYFDCNLLVFSASIAKFPDERKFALDKVTPSGIDKSDQIYGTNYSITASFNGAGKMKPKLSNMDTRSMSVNGTIEYDDRIH